MPRRKKLVASVTELQQFQNCRRRWKLSRQWESKTTSPQLWFGTGIHAALEAFYNAKRAKSENPTASMLGVWNMWVAEEYKTLHSQFASLWPEAKEAYDEIVRIGTSMLTYYPLYEASSDVQFTPLLVERRVYINLGDGNKLAAKLDLLGRLVGDGYAVIDNKTSSRNTNTGQALDIDEQGTGYTYAVWKVLDDVPEFVLNVLFKTTPETPKVVRVSAKNPKGELTQDKRTNTSYDLYMAAIKERGESPLLYQEMLNHLATKGWDGFYKREVSPRNLTQVKNYENRAKVLFEEMRRAIMHDEYAYPSPSPLRCPRCPFAGPCLAMEEGSDAEQLLKISFNRVAENAWITPVRIRKEVAMEEIPA